MVGRKILLFQTAGLEFMEEILTGVKAKDELYLVLPAKADIPSEISKLKHKIIRIGKEYIDYRDIFENQRIPPIHYDEVWLPSSVSDNYDEFAEVYACLTNIKFDWFIWKGKGKEFVVNNKLKYRIREKINGKIVNWWFKVFYKAEKIESCMKGYKE